MGTKRFKKRWIVLFSVMAVISVAGLFAPVRSGLYEMVSDSVTANVAWMITATFLC